VAAADRLGCELRTHDLVDILLDAEVDLPGLAPNEDPEAEYARKKVLRGTGRRLSSLFKKADANRIEADRFEVQRIEGLPDIHGNGRPVIRYLITRG
jgi:hypothetical protein